GASAARRRGVTRSVLRSLVSPDSSPGSTLERLNRVLCESSLGSMFVTLYLGMYRIPTGLLRYSNAGHPVPFQVASNGAVRPFGEVTGPILGILESSCYADREEWLAPEDRIILFTDGITEARNAQGEYFGAGRV